MHSLGRSVPDDISVVAICPDEVAERCTPALDSVLIPAEEVGTRAVELLMHKIEGRPAPGSTLLPPRCDDAACGWWRLLGEPAGLGHIEP